MAIVPDSLDVALRDVQVAVLAKAPIPGLAKTRLIPALGARGAARLQRQMTLRALRCAAAANLGPVTLWCTPDTGHRFFRSLRRISGIRCLVQPRGDLGSRMHTAFRVHCVEGPVLLIGTDCPALTPAHLRAAARALLQGHDATFYPAEDGGYVLVGLRRPQACLFRDVPWSSSEVMSCSRQRATDAGLSVCEFEPLWDVDLPADLPRLYALQEISNT